MIRKITFLILVICAICVASFMFSFSSSGNNQTIEADLNLKKVHLQKATPKGNWGREKSQPKGIYSSTNSYCVNQCTASGGNNCGTNRIVCCDEGMCFGGQDDWECVEELYIQGCDS